MVTPTGPGIAARRRGRPRPGRRRASGRRTIGRNRRRPPAPPAFRGGDFRGGEAADQGAGGVEVQRPGSRPTYRPPLLDVSAHEAGETVGEQALLQRRGRVSERLGVGRVGHHGREDPVRPERGDTHRESQLLAEPDQLRQISPGGAGRRSASRSSSSRTSESTSG